LRHAAALPPRVARQVSEEITGASSAELVGCLRLRSHRSPCAGRPAGAAGRSTCFELAGSLRVSLRAPTSVMRSIVISTSSSPAHG